MLRTTLGNFFLNVFLFFTVVMLGVSMPRPGAAQEQIKPRMLIIFDTSGSMLFYIDGDDDNTGGDGSWDPWDGRFCCPGSGNSRLFIAKEAMRQMVFATGDIDFALMKFAQPYETSNDPDDYYQGNGYTGNQREGFRDVLRYQSTACPTFEAYSSTVEGSASEWLCVEFPDDDMPDNRGPIMMWMDHHEFKSDGSGEPDTVPYGWSREGDGEEQELRAVTGTPLASSLYAAESYLESVFTEDYDEDPARAVCRPYSVILLTDGEETCGGDTNAASVSLHTLEDSPVTKDVSIWAIGFAYSGEMTELDEIASNGGTEYARTATSSTELSGVLYDIVSDSILVEVCDQADNDCDGETDEDFRPDRTYCNKGDTCTFPNDGQAEETQDILCVRPSECACDGIDNNCDGETDEAPDGESSWPVYENVCGGCADEPQCTEDPDEGRCDRGNLVCVPGAGYQCVGSVAPTEETCNGLDDDCDGETDEGIVGESCGACGDGNWYCVSGETVCCGSGTTTTCEPIQTPTVEECNGLDDDCDGETDENVFETCGGCDEEWCADVNEGVCAEGRRECSDGALGDCEGEIGPTEESCDNLDNDCDGETDEGIVGDTCGTCGDGRWYCLEGAEECCASVAGDVCEAVRDPAEETCNGVDDDCDGETDEGLGLRECYDTEYETYYGTGVCSKGYEVCRNGAWGNENPSSGSWEDDYCLGLQNPEEEECDGLDNDCDGETDEGTSGAEGCGPCGDGREECINGILQCTDATSPVPEECNGLDDNCNGLTDEGLSLVCGGCRSEEDGDAGVDEAYEDCLAAQAADTDIGPGEGECREGARACDPEADDLWGECAGSIGPVSETCDGLDNDCDGETDEEDEIENVNEVCATAVGICEEAWWRCVDDGEGGKGLECCVEVTTEGECVEPTSAEVEECNGLDDDCDGLTDEDLANAGESCGNGVGACGTGTYQCVCEEDDNPESCAIVCVGASTGTDEECNAIDDDCDGETDEDLPLGNECTNAPGGVATGECDSGYEECINGAYVCNANSPTDEICDGLDNDCDGATDENLAVDCPGGSICVAGECASTCVGAELQCPSGLACVETETALGTTVSVCTTDVCRAGSENALGCVDNPYWCDEGYEPLCKCNQSLKKCTSICDEVLCADGKTCVAKTGQCQTITEECYATGCPSGEVCRDGECMEDSCPDECPDGEYCNTKGECVEACVDMACPVRCFEGACVDYCDGVTCEDGEVCNDITGECEVEGACDNVTCKYYETCQGGECVEDPCFTIKCPNGLVCEDGTCRTYGDENVPEDTDSETEGNDTGDTDGKDTGDTSEQDSESEDNSYGMDRVLATGMGGCLCSATPGAAPKTGSIWLLGLLALGLSARFLSRKRLLYVSLEGVWILGLLTALGCTTEPYVFNKGGTETGSGGEDSDPPDGGGDTETGEDSETEECSTDRADDDCDGVDDDCDGETDEDVDLLTNAQFCGSCDNDCRDDYNNAFGVCEAGKCKMGDCSASYYDRNDDESDGCETYCKKQSETDVCNGVDLGDGMYAGVDDDCDGETDEEEDLGLQSDVFNCGRCGNVCQIPNVTASCVDGKCVYDASKDCDENFHDINGNAEDGCEYSCEKISDEESLCNGVDDDCDGETDEGNPEGGGACYELSSGCEVDGDNITCPESSRCKAGERTCENGSLTCVGQQGPLPVETCNGVDDNCNGEVDENLVESCTSGGDDFQEEGVCRRGYRLCENGMFDETVCEGETLPSEEVCDGFDNDCDGETDEGADGGVLTGDACGSCGGIEYCFDGLKDCCVALDTDGGCIEPQAASAEVCDGLDNDCDGETDNGIVEGLCDGDDADECTEGVLTCVGGAMVCTDDSGDNAEVCDGLDNDCDGLTDDEDSDLVPVATDYCKESCGTAYLGATCMGASGWKCNYDCANGVLECNSSDQVVSAETLCDGLDNDCDGETDENLTSTVDNCGACGNVCETVAGDHVASMVCVSGECRVSECEEGYHNLNGDFECEYGPCTETGSEGDTCDGLDNDCNGMTDEGPASTEVCDGVDNDCDDLTDEGMTAPDLCNSRCPSGSCTVTCDGADGWQPHYDCDTVDCKEGDDTSIKDEETKCDGVDNNCDGSTDEGFLLWEDRESIKGAQCTSDGLGACSLQGWVKCSADQTAYICCGEQSGDTCDEVDIIPEAPTGEAEAGTAADGVDNDCDGMTDEGADGCVETLSITGEDGSFEIFKYEASKRVSVQAAPCSEAQSAGDAPWANVSFEEARAACLRLNDNDSATCSYDDPDSNPETCWDLCSSEQWYYACAYGNPLASAPHLYPYGDSYESDACNGVDYDTDDSALASGAASGCLSLWDTDGELSDLSGNMEEWTLEVRTVDGVDLRVIRGGSYKSVEGGLACNFDFFAAEESDFQMDQIGFRCCKGSNPLSTCQNALDGLANHPFDFNLTGNSSQCFSDGWWRASGSDPSEADSTTDWELGTTGLSAVGTSSCVYATSLEGTYSSSSNSYLYSPWMDFSGCEDTQIDLTWNMYFDNDGDTGDYLYVQIRTSSDEGDTWGDWSDLGSHMSANVTDWSEVQSRTVTSSVSADTLYQLRFVFHADSDGDVDNGAYLDNVTFEMP